MKKQCFAREIALCLLCVMLFVTLIGCGEGSGTDTGTEPPVTDSGSGAVTVCADDLNLPDTTYDGEDFVILMTANGPDTVNDFDAGAATNDTMSQAVERRNRLSEQRFGVKIATVVDFKYGNSGYNKMWEAITSYSKEYDASLITAYDVVPLAYNKCLYDLNSLPYLNARNSWWDQNAYAELSIRDTLFFTTGDIAYWDDLNQYCVAFNKHLYQIKSQDNPVFPESLYETVKAGNWTYDLMGQLAKTVTDDVNGDQTMTMADAFGIITWDDTVYGVLNSAGQKVVTLDAPSGELTLTLTGNEVAISALSEYTDLCFGGDAINYQRTGNTQKGTNDMFADSRALFFLTRLTSLEEFRDMDVDYGILPYPKYRAEQDRYYTLSSPYHMNYVCVLNIEDGTEKSGAVLESLAYDSKEILTPAYYQTTLEGQYFRDDESGEMLSLMAASRIYDMGYLIQPDNINKHLIYLFRDGSKTFASTFEAHRDAAEYQVDEINQMFRDAVIEWQK